MILNLEAHSTPIFDLTPEQLMRKGGWSFYDQRMRWVHEEKYFIHISEECLTNSSGGNDFVSSKIRFFILRVVLPSHRYHRMPHYHQNPKFRFSVPNQRIYP